MQAGTVRVDAGVRALICWTDVIFPSPDRRPYERRFRGDGGVTGAASGSRLVVVMNLLPHLVNGIALGVLFGLLALGFMLIVGVMELINLAHGSLFALGAYVAMEIVTPSWLGSFGAAYREAPLSARYALAFVLAPILVGALGMILELCVRRTYGKKAEYGLLLTFGAALVLEEGIRLVWGPGEKTLAVPEEVNGAFAVGGLIYSRYRLFAALVGAALIGLVWLFLEKTPYGARVKAGAHDSEMVRALGINIDRLRLFVFAFGAALAAAAGIVLTPIWGLRPHVGVDAVIPAFLIIVLGGVGSFWGAVVAGQLVGIVVGVTGGYAAEWSTMSMYLLLIVVLSVRARGLLGKRSALEA
jgi:branched-chain amino acid transport system permease protein